MKKTILIIITALLLLGLMTFSISAEDKTTIQGDTVYTDAGEQVTVALKITENAGFCALVLRISYDNEALTLVSMENKASGMTFTKPSSDPYKSGNKYLWDNLSPYTSTGDLVILTFDISDSADNGRYDISVEFIEAYKLVDNQIEDVSVTVSDARIYVGVDETETTEQTTSVVTTEAESDETVETTEASTAETSEAESESVTEAQTSGSGSGSGSGYTPPAIDDTDDGSEESSSEDETEILTETVTDIASESETLVVDETEITSETEDTKVVTEMPTEVTSEVEVATETYTETENQEVDSATDVATNETDSYVNSEEESETVSESATEIDSEIDSETENVTAVGGCRSFISGFSILLLAMPTVIFLTYKKDKKQ